MPFYGALTKNGSRLLLKVRCPENTGIGARCFVMRIGAWCMSTATGGMNTGENGDNPMPLFFLSPSALIMDTKVAGLPGLGCLLWRGFFLKLSSMSAIPKASFAPTDHPI